MGNRIRTELYSICEKNLEDDLVKQVIHFHDWKKNNSNNLKSWVSIEEECQQTNQHLEISFAVLQEGKSQEQAQHTQLAELSDNNTTYLDCAQMRAASPNTQKKYQIMEISLATSGCELTMIVILLNL